MPSEWCAATVIATDESMRVSSSTAIAYDERVGAGAAVLLGNRHAHQAELGELGDELVREALLAVELLGDRCDALERELADRVAEELVLRLKVEVHCRCAMVQRRHARIRRRILADVRHPPTIEALTEEIGRIVSERQDLALGRGRVPTCSRRTAAGSPRPRAGSRSC